ncbi:MAG: PAS domain-containing protein, partial [Dehalococcoidia bacterium]
WWNDGMLDLFGFDQEALESTSESWTNRIHPDDVEQVVSGIRAAMDSPRDDWSSEYRFLRADGTYAYVVDRGVVIRDESGSAVRMVGGMTDLTAQREAQAEVRRQAALIEQARDAILVFSVDGRITSWNSSAARVYGVPTDWAIGQGASELTSTDQLAFQSALESVLRDGAWQGRLTFQSTDEPHLREAVAECRWTLLRDEEGAPSAVLAIHSDITEQVVLQRQFEQSQRLESLGQLTGGIAHDFNNLLTVVMGSSEMLIEALEHDDRLRTSAEIMQTAAMRGAELTQRLLAFARQQPLDPEPHDLNLIVTAMEPLLRRTIGGNIRVELSLASDLSLAVVDSAQIESCILNLSINARDAMPQGGTLTIETANVELDEAYAAQHAEVTAGPYVMLAVSDTGIGMSPDVMGRVFEPFFTTKPIGRGNGLGLSMVYGFVKQSGGHVKVYSEIGEGTAVKVYLPWTADPAMETVVAPVRAGRQVTGEHILVVEDDDLVRAHVTDLLQGMGYRATVVSSGHEALEVLRTDVPIDLLYTDIVMPGMNGQELAELARDLRPDLPVLFTSGYTENAVVQQGRIPPGTFLLSKPYSRGELDSKLRQVLADGMSSSGEQPI